MKSYATVYKVKLNLEFVYVYVQYNDQFPRFEEFIAAIKEQCGIDESSEVEIRDDKECKIPNEIIFGHFMRYIYKPDTFFVVTASVPTVTTIANSQQQEATQPECEEFPPIYENPDKFFIYFLAKDLVTYFKNQTQIICNPTGAILIEKYHIQKEQNLVEPHKKSIIQISANHLMLIKNNDPTTHDRTLWAKVICEVFGQLRDINSGANYYLAVYNSTKGDGFLGNRIKLLKKAAKRIVTNQAIIAQLNGNPVEAERRVEEIDVNGTEQLIEFLKTADITKDLATVIDYHKKTFPVRQQYRQTNSVDKLMVEFPRFFDVHGLIDEDYALIFPLSGLATFTQGIQQKIINIGKASKNYIKFPTSHKNLAEPLNALVHLILLLPPQSLGRGCKNRVKIEDAFPRLVQIHEVNQPLSDVANVAHTAAFIVVSGRSDNDHKLFYVSFQGRLIKCESAFRAIDILLKVHYVFNIVFDTNVRHVLAFIAHYFYNVKDVEPTSQMRILNTQLIS